MWQVVAKIGVSLLVAGVEKWIESRKPTPSPEPAPEVGPIVTSGTSIPILFGTTRIRNAPLLWSDIPMEKSTQSPDRRAFGTRAQFLLCYGPIVTIHSIQSSAAGIRGTPVDVSDITHHSHQNKNAMWYDLNYSPWRLYAGYTIQPADPLLDAMVPDGAGITYKDVAHIVLGEIDDPPYAGERKGPPFMSARWKYVNDAGLDITFVVSSDPTGTSTSMAQNGGCNPARIIWALCTSGVYGDAIPPSDLDETSFDRAADLLDDEGWGLTYFETGERGSNALKEDVLRHIGGVLSEGNLYLIRPTGTNLYGVPYDDSATIISDSDILEVLAYSVENVTDKPNYQTVRYIRRGFEVGGFNEQESFATASDISDPTLRTVYAPDVEFLAIPNEHLAQKVAQRELERAQARLASMLVQIKTNRSLRVGRRVQLGSIALNIPTATYRIQSIDHGTPEDAITVLTLVEDVYTWHENAAGPTTPTPKPVAPRPDPGIVFEAPYRMSTSTNPYYVFGTAEKTHDQNVSYRVETEDDASATTSYIEHFTVVEGASVDVADLPVELIGDISTIPTAGGSTFGLWGREIVRVVRVGQNITLHRGMIDTVPHAHAPGEKLWIIGFATGTDGLDPLGGLVETDGVFADARILPITTRGDKLAYVAADPGPVNFVDRWSRPYPPRNVSFFARNDKDGGFRIRLRWNSRENASINLKQTGANPNVLTPGFEDNVGIRVWGTVAPGVEGYFGELKEGIDFTMTIPASGGGVSTILVTMEQEREFTGFFAPVDGNLRVEVYTKRRTSPTPGLWVDSYQSFPVTYLAGSI